MSEYLAEAKAIVGLAEGREGPEDARHAVEVAKMYALISIAESLSVLAEDAEQLTFDDYGAMVVRAVVSEP